MKSNHIKLEHISPADSYEGYLWWSNQEIPSVYRNESLPDWPIENDNPFIVEGHLFCRQQEKSYSIRYFDGGYSIHCFELFSFEGIEYLEKEYLPNRMNGVSRLCFREYWRLEQDEFCEGMEVLKPAEVVFTGFKFKEE